jgi:hypothetical protein
MPMWNFVDNLSQDGLDSWYRWLTIFAIGLPILGAIAGGICGWGAFTVSNRINDLQAAALKHAQNTAAEARKFAMPRRLSPETAGRMLAVARQFCPQIKRIPVTAANGNQEAQAYALDFVKVFKDAGCDSDLQLPIPGLTPDVQGVRIGVRKLTDIPAGVGLIDKILLAGEIRYEVNPLTPDFFPEEPVVFIVGAKPPQPALR